MSNEKPLTLTLYSRPECHLCVDMLEALTLWQKTHQFNVDIINIDSDIKLTRRFAARIPVLAHNEIEICQYHINESALDAFFKNQA